MKTFLKVDLGIQTFLFIALFVGIVSIVVNSEWAVGIAIYLYLMGIWQPLSALIHLLIAPEKNRGIYLISAVGYVGLLFLLAYMPLLLPIYFVGVFAFSLWYFRISYDHLKRLENVSRSFWDLA